MCVLIFSTTLSEIFLILKRNERVVIEPVYWSSRKVLVIFVRFLKNLEFLDSFFEKYLNIKFHENPSSGGRVFSPENIRTDRHDEANSRFSKFYEKRQKNDRAVPNLPHYISG